MLVKKEEKKVEPKEIPKEEIWVCNNCGSENIEQKSWTLTNQNNKFVEEIDDAEYYCQDCQEGGIEISLKNK